MQSGYREKCSAAINVDTFISGGSSVQLGLSHQAWSCLSKRTSVEAVAAAEHDCFAFSEDISALMRRPAPSLFKKRPKCTYGKTQATTNSHLHKQFQTPWSFLFDKPTLRELWILSGICIRLFNPNAGLRSQPSAWRLTHGSCLLLSPIKKPNALEQQATQTWMKYEASQPQQLEEMEKEKIIN